MSTVGSRRTVALLVVWVLAASAAAPQDGPAPLETSEPVSYFIAEGAPDTGYRASDHELAEWALQAWAGTIGPQLRLVETPEDEALIRVYWAPADGGQYGQMQALRVGGRRGAAVFIRPDTSGLGPVIGPAAARDPLLRETIVYLTCVHELGHAFGLMHTADFDDIMYSFQFGGDLTFYFQRYRDRLTDRASIAGESGLSPADVARVQALYPR